MVRIPLPGTDSALLLTPRWADLDTTWQIVLPSAFLIVPTVLIVGLYRRELRLVRRRTAIVLLGLRVLSLVLLWFLIGFQPMVARMDVQDASIIVAVDCSASMDIADPQRNPAEKLRLANALHLGDSESGGDALAALSRSEIARRVLAPEGADLLSTLARQFSVALFGFHKGIAPAQALDKVFPLLKQKQADGTDLNLPLTQALEQSSGRPVRAVVLLSDGQHTGPVSPIQQARELGARGVPIYPVFIGSKRAPADIALVESKCPANVFKDTEAKLEAHVKVTGIPPQDLLVELRRRGDADKILDARVLRHDGTNRSYATSFALPTAEVGTHAYEVKVHAAHSGTTEATQANNLRTCFLRVVQDKVRVLVVDGEARWEYQYLVNALTRDKTATLDRVLFVQPRLGLVPEPELEKAEHARLKLAEPAQDKTHDPLHDYDCIVLGDVAPEHLRVSERRRLIDYVARRGGTLIVQAGKRFMPLEYFRQAPDDPFLKVLPIAAATRLKPSSGFPLGLTAEGRRTGFMQLDTPDMNHQRWAELPKHYWGAVGPPRPGASVLAFASDSKSAATADREKKQGVLLLQNYGLGRVLYAGIESTWRWRFKVGDLYHHRFWGQVIRWAGADKLLPAGNKYVRYGSRDPVYEQGQPVQLAVRLGDALANPLRAPARLSIVQLLPDGNKEIAEAVLRPGAGDARLLTTELADLPPGTYRIIPAIPERKNKSTSSAPGQSDAKDGDTFTVIPRSSREMLDVSANWDLLHALAVESKGELLTPDTVQRLPNLLAKEVASYHGKQEIRLWRDEPMVWYILSLLLVLLGIEWGLRKMAGLP